MNMMNLKHLIAAFACFPAVHCESINLDTSLICWSFLLLLIACHKPHFDTQVQLVVEGPSHQDFWKKMAMNQYTISTIVCAMANSAGAVTNKTKRRLLQMQPHCQRKMYLLLIRPRRAKKICSTLTGILKRASGAVMFLTVVGAEV